MERSTYTLVFDELRYCSISSQIENEQGFPVSSEMPVVRELINTGATDREIAHILSLKTSTINDIMLQVHKKFVQEQAGFKRILLLHALSREGILTQEAVLPSE